MAFLSRRVLVKSIYSILRPEYSQYRPVLARSQRMGQILWRSVTSQHAAATAAAAGYKIFSIVTRVGLCGTGRGASRAA